MANPFYGYDSGELAEKWGLYIPEAMYRDYMPMTPEEYLGLYIQEYLFKLDIRGRSTRAMRAAAKDVRLYCQALQWDAGYFDGVWKAISEIEDDFSLLQMFCLVIEATWN